MAKNIQFSGVTAKCKNLEVHHGGGFFSQLIASEILSKKKVSDRIDAIKQLLSIEHTATGCTRELTFQVLERPHKPSPKTATNNLS